MKLVCDAWQAGFLEILACVQCYLIFGVPLLLPVPHLSEHIPFLSPPPFFSVYLVPCLDLAVYSVLAASPIDIFGCCTTGYLGVILGRIHLCAQPAGPPYLGSYAGRPLQPQDLHSLLYRVLMPFCPCMPPFSLFICIAVLFSPFLLSSISLSLFRFLSVSPSLLFYRLLALSIQFVTFSLSGTSSLAFFSSSFFPHTPLSFDSFAFSCLSPSQKLVLSKLLLSWSHIYLFVFHKSSYFSFSPWDTLFTHPLLILVLL